MKKKINPRGALVFAIMLFSMLGVMAQDGSAIVSKNQNAEYFSSDSLTTQPKPQKKQQLTNYDFGKYGTLKLSGYVQAQWQWAESEGALAFAQGGVFPSESNNRFMVRRGRIKLEYKIGFAKMVIQPDISEKGLKVRDVYINAMSKNNFIGGQIGGFDRPFGYEISYSSSKRESPERSRIYNALMPGEREIGAMLKMNYFGFSLDAGLFNGNGLSTDNDSHKDFIGRIMYQKDFKSGTWGAEFSLYEGSVYNMSTNYFTYEKGEGYVWNSATSDKNYKREYFGIGGYYLQNWCAGTTKLYGEYLCGTQPGTLLLNYNIVGDGDIIEEGNPLYLRKFRGGYITLAQTIAKSKHAVVFKCDYYDPNIYVSGDEIGKLTNTGRADIAYTTLGVGYIFNWTNYLKLTAYYDFVINETSKNYIGYQTQRDEDVLTLRVQFKF